MTFFLLSVLVLLVVFVGLLGNGAMLFIRATWWRVLLTVLSTIALVIWFAAVIKHLEATP